MTWVLAAAIMWLLVAVLIGVLVGRGIRLADATEARTAAEEAASPNFVVDSSPFTPDQDGAPSVASTGSPIPAPRGAAQQPSFRHPDVA